jgi:hypothetical protein
MKRFAVAAFALILSVSAGHALTIRNDGGGLVFLKIVEVSKAINSGQIVRIDGRCDSSCTLHLQNPRTCATIKASLAFHAASKPSATLYLLSKYPPRIRAYIAAHGGLTERLIFLRGREAQRLIGAC